MITELKSEDRKKIIRLIKNTQHELTIEASIEGTAPSHIYVDNVSAPTSGLIKTPECNVIFGDPNNSKFNTQILDEIDYYDSITCDDTDWNEFIENNHYNCAIKKFKRHYYQLKKQHFISDKVIVDKTKIDIVTSNTLKAIAYENAEVIHNWININNLEAYENLPLAAVVVENNKILSCAAVDCIVNNKVEIGVQTTKGFMKQGYGKQAVFALIETLFSKGVEQIGWHCMGTNTGSIQIANAIGLKHALSYDFFVPYPPIENIGDLSAVKWAEYAEFYMHQGVKSADQYWVAMKCWANAENLNKVFECIEYLLDSDNKWFINMIPEHEEFTVFEHNTLWKNKLITLMKQDSDG